MNGKTFRNRLLASSVIAGATFAVVTAPAVAQEEEEAVQETVLVTGSRIAKQDFVSNSPIATVDAEVFELTGAINTEDVLNTLPQAVPGFDRTSNNPGNGTATADLRGLGSARTLVLVDGKRFVPTTSAGVVDLNNIPASMIERVEVITGGASAVYGSDAISGVVNFILKDDFEGMEANFGYESTFDQGDAQFYNADLTIGANFDNNRGNVTVNIGYTSREDVFQGDRDFSNVALGDGDTEFIEFGSSGVPAGHSFDTFDFTALGQAPLTAATDPTNIACGTAGTSLVDPDSSLDDEDGNSNPLTPFISGDEFCGGQGIFDLSTGFRPWINGGAGNDRYNYAPVNYLQLPQERFNTTTVARYNINANTEVYARFTGAFNQVPQQLAPTPAFTSITTQLDNPFLTADQRAGLVNLANTQIAQAQGSLDGLRLSDFEDTEDGTAAENFAAAQASAQTALDTITAANDADGDGTVDQVSTFIGRRLQETGGRISNDDFFAFQVQTGLRGTISDRFDYDVYFQTGRTQANTDLSGDISLTRYLEAVNVTDDGSGNPVCSSGNSACVPLNIFGENTISDAAGAYITAGLNSKAEYNQTILSGTLSGDTAGLVELPGGPIGWAIGGEYREEDFDFRPDDNLGTGNLLGFNANPPLSGGFDVYDIYGEVYVPVLADMPGAELLAIEAAFRVSDYSTVGNTETFKIGGEYAPIEGLRFRGLYNTAVRAPNVAELFSAVGNGFPGATDPCSASQDPDGEGIAALCTATGVPNVGTYEQRNTQIEGLFGGNPGLEPEEAETYTIGAVFEPYFLDGLTVSVDYYSIEIEEYITTLAGGVQGILNQCYNAENNPSQDPNTQFCQAVNRQRSGEPLVLANLANAGSLETAGFDIVVDYQFEIDAIPGNFGVVYSGTVLDKWDFFAFEGAEVNDCKGRFGAFCDDPISEYKHVTTFSWANGPFSTQLRWERIGEATDDDDGTDFLVETIDAFDYFNLAGSWDVNDNLRITAGIDNLLDEEPPILGDNQEQANTFPATYDPFGRTGYIAAKVRF
ncbi:MAG: TonB-dependent receptor [Pseudomonadota bacterium]